MENTYPDGNNFVCADCGFEWPQAEVSSADEEADAVVKDSNGQVLQDGDAVALIKDLKVKGSSTVLKMGTKVKSRRLVGGDLPYTMRHIPSKEARHVHQHCFHQQPQPSHPLAC